MYPLEHFYYGQLVHHGKPEGEMRVLARSYNVEDEHVAEAIRAALIPPMEGNYGAWAVVRGKVNPFYLVQSQIGSAKNPILHIYLLPSEALRSLAGNLQGFMALLKETLPIYQTLGDDLVPVTLAIPESPSASEQVDMILELMTYTKNRINTIEALLAAVVEGTLLAIQNAPANLKQRTTFLQGLLTLLPSSTRFSVTFTTSNSKTARINAQISFMEDDAPAGAVVYDWATAQVSGKEVKDDYSRYIVSQLRLDAELALQRAEELTPVAGWRFKSGDKLADALSYASSRVRLDNALATNQPVEVEEVSRVLADDPTLDDTRRVLYANHLLKIGLAMDKMDLADPVAVMIRTNKDLDKSALQHITDALKNGSTGLVYETLVRWMSNPLGPQSEQWIALTHKTMMTYLEAIIEEQDMEGIALFTKDLQRHGDTLGAIRITPPVIQKLLPLLDYDSALGSRLLQLGFSYMDMDNMRRLMGVKQLMRHLPPAVGQVLSAINNNERIPIGGLVEAAGVLGDTERGHILLRLVALAEAAGRPELVDTPVLERLSRVAQSPSGQEYANTLIELAKKLHEGNLTKLAEPGPRYLLQIMLALKQYPLLMQMMIRQARDLYPGDLQTEYIRMIQKLFGDVSMTPDEARAARNAMQSGGLKGIPFLMVSVGVLEASNWSGELWDVAQDVSETLFNNQNYLELMHPSAVMALLNFYAKQQDVKNTARVAELVSLVASHQETIGLSVLTRAYKLMQWDDSVKAVSLEMLRKYVRASDDKSAQNAIKAFGKSLGPEVQHKLENTYILSRFMGRLDLIHYANFVHLAADILEDTAGAYVEKNFAPESEDLRNVAELARKDATDDERKSATDALAGLTRAIVFMQKQHRASGAKKVESLLTGESGPGCALDIFWVMAGSFARGKRHTPAIEAHKHSNPFIRREPDQIREDIEATAAILVNAAKTISGKVELTVRDVKDEMGSLWKSLPEDKRGLIAQTLAVDLQRIAELTLHIANNGDATVLEADNNTGKRIAEGKHRPRSTLEFFRYGMTWFR